MTARVVLVLGGYGTFGRLIVASLANHAELRVLVAGRNRQAAQAVCQALPGRLVPVELDCGAADFSKRLEALSPEVVIDTVGPFQARDYSAARACIAAGAHYIDLADGRDYVSGIASLERLSVARGVLTVSGASTCPALSTAVVDVLSTDFASMREVALAIAPGQRAPRGLATTRSVLSYCGKPIPGFDGGKECTIFGWSGLTQHTYPPPVGRRWLSYVDLPETALWPARYPSLQKIETRAGLGGSLLHLSLSALSRLVRMGAVRSLAPYAQGLLQVARAFDPFGADGGAMHITVSGPSRSGSDVRITWCIVAEHDSGPRIPAAPAALLAKKLLGVAGYLPLARRGAMPCIGLLSLEEILAELARFPIRIQLSGDALPA